MRILEFAQELLGKLWIIGFLLLFVVVLSDFIFKIEKPVITALFSAFLSICIMFTINGFVIELAELAGQSEDEDENLDE